MRALHQFKIDHPVWTGAGLLIYDIVLGCAVTAAIGIGAFTYVAAGFIGAH